MLSALPTTQNKNTVTNLRAIFRVVLKHKNMYNQHL